MVGDSSDSDVQVLSSGFVTPAEGSGGVPAEGSGLTREGELPSGEVSGPRSGEASRRLRHRRKVTPPAEMGVAVTGGMSSNPEVAHQVAPADVLTSGRGPSASGGNIPRGALTESPGARGSRDQGEAQSQFQDVAHQVAPADVVTSGRGPSTPRGNIPRMALPGSPETRLSRDQGEAHVFLTPSVAVGEAPAFSTPLVANVNVFLPAMMAENAFGGSLMAMSVDETRGVPRKSGTEDTPPRGAKSPRLALDGGSLPAVPGLPQFVTTGGGSSVDREPVSGQVGLFGLFAGGESSGDLPRGGPAFDYGRCAFELAGGVRCPRPPVDLLPCRLEAPGVPVQQGVAWCSDHALELCTLAVSSTALPPAVREFYVWKRNALVEAAEERRVLAQRCLGEQREAEAALSGELQARRAMEARVSALGEELRDEGQAAHTLRGHLGSLQATRVSEERVAAELGEYRGSLLRAQESLLRVESEARAEVRARADRERAAGVSGMANQDRCRGARASVLPCPGWRGGPRGRRDSCSGGCG